MFFQILQKNNNEIFKKEFIDDTKSWVTKKWIFDNRGITIEEKYKESYLVNFDNGKILHCFCPYDRVFELKCNQGLGSMEITFLVEANEHSMSICIENCNTQEIKSAISFALKQKKNSKNTTEFKRVQVFKKVESNKFDSGEYIMQCQTCGQVFRYTNADLNKNEEIKKEADKINSQAAFNSFFVSYTVSAIDKQRAENKLNTMVDYSSCPKCKSSKLKRISEEELHQIQEKENAPVTSTTLSSADELKKFKELLDSGVITQEEFDAKKKELLGL